VGKRESIGASGGVGVLRRAEPEPGGVSLGAGWSEDWGVGADRRCRCCQEKRRWMRVFAISRLIITQKTRRIVRSRQRRDPAHPLDPLHATLLQAIFRHKTNVARATISE
jgi:hypothetical protein